MKKFTQARGAVSVFLVMILVPCIVVTSVFVDLGRVHMSKSMAASASDLALNSLLTHYDTDLNEWYGMVASCQNIDDFYEVSAQFFLRTISSQGLSDEEIVTISDYYAAATNDDTIYDLLKIDCKTAPSEMIKPVAEANLSNPTFIKDEIVEFMKYRAPIELTTDVIDRFLTVDDEGNLVATGEIDAALESDENEPLIEAKQQFYETEGELFKAAYKTYLAIMDYYNDASSKSLSNTKLEEYKNRLTEMKDTYAYVHRATVKNLVNTKDLEVYYRTTKALDSYNSTYTESHSDVYTTKETVDDVTTYYIDGDRITSLLNGLQSEINDFNTQKGYFEDAGKTLLNTLPGTGDYDANPMQWWVQMDKALHGSTNWTSKVSSAADDMLKAYSKVLAIKSCTLEGDEIPDDWESTYTTLTNTVSSLQGTYLTAGITHSTDIYLRIVSQLESVSSANQNNKNPANIYVTVNGTTKSVDTWISDISTELTDLSSWLEERVNELEIAIKGNGKWGKEKIHGLNKLAELAQEYSEDFAAWEAETAPSGMGTTLQGDNYDEIYGGTEKYPEGLQLEQKINKAAVTELKTRLEKIKSQLESLITAINGFEYGNKDIANIADYDAFLDKLKGKVNANSIPLKNKDIDDYAGETFGQLIKGGAVSYTYYPLDNNANPDINPNDTGTVDTPELFKHMHSKFAGTPKDQFEKAEEEEDAAKERQAQYEEEQKGKAREYRGGGTPVPTVFSSSSSSYGGAGTLLTSLGSLIGDLTSGNFDGIRDDLYVTTYAMKMFSFATQDREIMYSLLTDDQRNALTPSNIGSYYTDTVKGNATTPNTLLSEGLTDSYNKTLTNKMLNNTYNKAYLAEVEYILYGQNTNEENLKNAFNDIYTIRILLNTVSAFQHFWSGASTTATAIEMVSGFISMAFGGVIPAPVIKAVLLPILAAVESCKDISRLSCGMPVELYKIKDEQWWVSLPDNLDSYSAVMDALTGGSIDSGKNKDVSGLYYSDYLLLFVYSGFCKGGELEENMYKRIAEVIQANIGKQIGEDSGYSLQKSIVYFKMDATLRVKPLMITLPIFNDYSNNMDTKTDWCTYKINTTRGYS